MPVTQIDQPHNPPTVTAARVSAAHPGPSAHSLEDHQTPTSRVRSAYPGYTNALTRTLIGIGSKKPAQGRLFFK